MKILFERAGTIVKISDDGLTTLEQSSTKIGFHNVARLTFEFVAPPSIVSAPVSFGPTMTSKRQLKRKALTPLEIAPKTSTTIRLSAINYEKVAKTANSPDTWLCHRPSCETTMSLWICLHCGHCFCRDSGDDEE